MSNVETMYVDSAAGQWRSGFTGIGSSAPLNLGAVVYTPAEIAAWTTGAPYTDLAADNMGNVSRTVNDLGTSVTTTGGREDMKDQGVFACVQAILWAIDGNAARLTAVKSALDAVKDITTYSVAVGQDNLEAGWFAPTYCRAAAIIGRVEYDDANFDNFLENVLYDMMDWPTAFNWHAVFADGRCSIASYLEDATLWADAKAYTEYRIAQGIYHSTYDGLKVNSLPNQTWPTTSPANTTVTGQHWGIGTRASAYEMIDSGSNREFVAPWTLGDGTTAEQSRDVGHEQSGLISYTHCARTAQAVNDPLSSEALTRLRAGVELQSERVLSLLVNGVVPAPVGYQDSGIGGTNHLAGWHNMSQFFTPSIADVETIKARTEVQNSDAGGANQTAGERAADDR